MAQNTILSHSGIPTDLYNLAITVAEKLKSIPYKQNVPQTIEEWGKLIPETVPLFNKILEIGKQAASGISSGKVKSPDFQNYAAQVYHDYTSKRGAWTRINEGFTGESSVAIVFDKSGLPYIGQAFSASRDAASKIASGKGPLLRNLTGGIKSNGMSGYDNKAIKYLEQITRTSSCEDDAKNLNDFMKVYFENMKGNFNQNPEIKTETETKLEQVLTTIMKPKYFDNEMNKQQFFNAAVSLYYMRTWLGIPEAVVNVEGGND